MRELIYVPIIHDEVDLGTAGEAPLIKNPSPMKKARWILHRKVMDRFWQGVAAYLDYEDPQRLKVYQDGMPTNGALGRHIAMEAARRGSKNYQLIVTLLDKKAELRKTEDPALLLQERAGILGLANSEGRERPLDYQLKRDRLLWERDNFIARTINDTLKEGEIGVLFIGAHHKIAPLLTQDIDVRMLKDRERVQLYFEELFFGQDQEHLRGLAKYLTAPVSRGEPGALAL